MTEAVVDLGKTRCRMRMVASAAAFDEAVSGDSDFERRASSSPDRQYPHVGPQAESAGAPGLSTNGGVAGAMDSILASLTQLRGPHARLRRIAVGAAGALASPHAAQALAIALSDRLGCTEVAVTSDAVTAHLGALGGAPGVTVVAGTGAVAVALSGTGQLAVADGAGPADGDLGSGGWIGREALALASAGRPTWVDLVVARLGADWPSLAVDNSFAAAGRRGALVPDVLELARRGDSEARDLIDRAAAALAATVRRAAAEVGADEVSGAMDIAVVGGLTNLGDLLLVPLAQAVAPARLCPAQGSALYGAELLLDRRDLPHESTVTRS